MQQIQQTSSVIELDDRSNSYNTEHI